MTAPAEAAPRRSATRADGRLARLRRRIAGTKPRTRWLNLGLLLLLVAAVVVSCQVLRGPGEQQPTGRTVVVNRADVTAVVTGSGNTGPSLSTPVSFGTTATVTAVNVKEGDTVTTGQVLATVDDTSAKASLRTAQAQYNNAAAALADAKAGPTEVAKQKDQLAITQAQQALDNAKVAVEAAQDKLNLDKNSTKTAVDNAKDKRNVDKTAQDNKVEQAQTNKDTACSDTSSDTAATSTNTSTTTTSTSTTSDTGSSSSSCTTAKQTLETAKDTRDSTLLTDDQAVTTAEQNRDSTLLADENSLDTANQDVTTKEGNLTSAQLTAEANLNPKTPQQIAQSQASVDSAQVTLDTAKHDVEQTVLKAPQDGVVLAVNGKVGESSGSTSSSSSSSSTSSGTGSSSASSVPDVATTAGDGFVVIANMSQLAVSASIPEADAAKLQLGQKTRITFPGTDSTATGTVTQITPQSTVTNNVVLYPISVSLDSAPPGVGVGSTAELSITTGTAPNVLSVPTQAITTNGTRHTVTVRKNGVDSVVPVEIGVSGPTDTEIKSGVAQGDTVVLPGTGGSA